MRGSSIAVVDLTAARFEFKSRRITMPAARARKRRSSGGVRLGPRLRVVPDPPASQVGRTSPQVLVHGVRLKTVSQLTLLFAFTCVAAFLASRPPASAYRL